VSAEGGAAGVNRRRGLDEHCYDSVSGSDPWAIRTLSKLS
jgi:hypothetical protein